MTGKLELSEVTYGERGNNVKGVMLGQEELFLEVRRKGKLWQLRLQDLFTGESGPRQLTAWFSFLRLEDLRRSPKYKTLRDKLKGLTNHGDDVIEKVLIEIENHKEEWIVKEKPKDGQNAGFSEAVETSILDELTRIVDAENQVETLQPHLNNIIVGEENIKKAVFVLLAGSKHKQPRMKQIILLKGTEGSGKTTLARELSRNYKVKEVGRFSAHALDYSNLEDFDVLFLKELGSMDMEKQGVSTLKFLSSDDRGYVVEVTVKDEESGKFTTEQHLIPCMTVISTTTRLILDSQFERRAWLLNVDETEEQTRRVLKWKAEMDKQRSLKLLGIREETDYEFSREVLKRFIEQWKPMDIIIPFPVTLTEVLGSNVLRIRGDLDKLYTFIRLYASLNLKRLRKLKLNVYAVTPEVAMEALQIIVGPLTNMLSKMDERTKKILDVLKTMELDHAQDTITKTERERIAVQLGKSERTIRSFFNSLDNGGIVSGDNKKPKTYTLLYSVKTIEEKLSGILDKLKSADLLIDRMRKEGREWLGSRLEIRLAEDTSYFNEKKHIGYASEHKKPLNNTCIPEKLISNPELSTPQPSLTEKPSEDRLNPKCPIFQGETPIKSERGGNSNRQSSEELSWIAKREGDRVVPQTGETPFQCPVCWRFKKQAVFNSQADLDTHLERCHSGYRKKVPTPSANSKPERPRVQIPPHNNWEQAYAKVRTSLKGRNFSPYVFQDAMETFGFKDEKRIDRLFWTKVSQEQIIMNDDNTFHFNEAS